MRTPLQEWHDRGSTLEVPGTAGTRIWRMGDGPPVVALHGVPSSGYLYRKVLPALADRGLEGITLDLQGLGFSDRPADFDYSWSGIAAWLARALDAAGLERFHLVVHDVGGPVGFDLIGRMPERIASLTVLNTITRVASFKKPMAMRPFEYPVLGPLMVMQMNSPAIVPFFRAQGVGRTPTNEEIRAYGELLVRGDRGKAFLKIMRNFETTEAFERRIFDTLGQRTFPAQVVWGRDDPELTPERFGEDARAALGLAHPVRLLDGKHFLQEDSPVEIAAEIAAIVESDEDR